MTVRYPEAAQQHKALLQLLVLEILKNYTDPGNPITKQKIIEKATEATPVSAAKGLCRYRLYTKKECLLSCYRCRTETRSVR